MEQVIDLRLHFPSSRKDAVDKLKMMFASSSSNGIANYRNIYGPRLAGNLGMSLEELQLKTETLIQRGAEDELAEIAEPLSISLEDYFNQLDEADVESGLILSQDTQRTANLIARYPDRLKGLIIIDPNEGDPAKNVEHAIKELGFSAVYASALHLNMEADDPRFFPIYAKTQELQIPVVIYTSMNFNTDMRWDIGHPRYIDAVARAFPHLKIIATCGGWPWVNEMVALARRHQNLYIDTCSHRPKHLATPGSGWEMLLQFANTLLQDRMVFSSGVGDIGLPLSQIVQEVRDLPLKEDVKRKWLYSNAAELFG